MKKHLGLVASESFEIELRPAIGGWEHMGVSEN